MKFRILRNFLFAHKQITFQGGRKQFASRSDFDWSYNELCREFKEMTDVHDFVEAVNFVIGMYNVVL
jgi:adenine C2-methylase RlmN of 23S rRNA A2503 and tRNA A37